MKLHPLLINDSHERKMKPMYADNKYLHYIQFKVCLHGRHLKKKLEFEHLLISSIYTLLRGHEQLLSVSDKDTKNCFGSIHVNV